MEPFALQMSGDWRGAAEVWRVIGCPYEVATALLDGGPDEIVDDVFVDWIRQAAALPGEALF